MDDLILSLAHALLESLLSQITKQIQAIEEQAMQPIRAIISQVVGGIWKGQGADAFVEEVSSLVIPGVAQVSERITTTHRDLCNGRDIMNRADNEVSNLVRSNLSDKFKFY
ncbi:MAG: hypothetical protein WCS37_00670 [Chloroflexota bacterium]